MKGRSSKSQHKDATDNQSDRDSCYCENKGNIARHHKKRINDEKGKAGQHRNNSKSNSSSVTQRVAALATSTPKVQVQSASSIPVLSLLDSPAHLAATYFTDGKTSGGNSTSDTVGTLQDEWQIPTAILECMMVEVDEQPTDDVWILHDTRSAATVCPCGIQQELGARNDRGGP